MPPLETSVLASLSFTAQSLNDDDDDDDGQTPGLVQHCCCNQRRILHFGQRVCSMGHSRGCQTHSNYSLPNTQICAPDWTNINSYNFNIDRNTKMPFKRTVEIGRVVMVTYGADYGKLYVISDVVDLNKVRIFVL